MFDMLCSRHVRLAAVISVLLLGVWAAAPAALQPGVAAGQGAAAAPVAQEAPRHAGGEANLVLPDLGERGLPRHQRPHAADGGPGRVRWAACCSAC